MPQIGVLGPLLFLLYTSVILSILGNQVYGCADDSTFVAVMPFPLDGVAVAESLNR